MYSHFTPKAGFWLAKFGENRGIPPFPRQFVFVEAVQNDFWLSYLQQYKKDDKNQQGCGAKKNKE